MANMNYCCISSQLSSNCWTFLSGQSLAITPHITLIWLPSKKYQFLFLYQPCSNTDRAAEQHSALSAISHSIPAPSPASGKCRYVVGMSKAYKYLGDTLKRSVISSYCRHPRSHHGDKRSTQQLQWNKSKDFFLFQPHLLFALTFKGSFYSPKPNTK